MESCRPKQTLPIAESASASLLHAVPIGALTVAQAEVLRAALDVVVIGASRMAESAVNRVNGRDPSPIGNAEVLGAEVMMMRSASRAQLPSQPVALMWCPRSRVWLDVVAEDRDGMRSKVVTVQRSARDVRSAHAMPHPLRRPARPRNIARFSVDPVVLS